MSKMAKRFERGQGNESGRACMSSWMCEPCMKYGVTCCEGGVCTIGMMREGCASPNNKSSKASHIIPSTCH